MRGGQIFMYSMRMMVQVLNRIFAWAIFFYALIVTTLIYVSSQDEIRIIFYHYKSLGLKLLNNINAIVWSSASSESITAQQMLSNPKLIGIYNDATDTLIKHAIMSLSFGGLVYLVVTVFFFRFFMSKGEKYSRDKVLSGTVLADNYKETARSVIKSPRGVSPIKLLNLVPIPKRSETQGILFHGSTGCGKTQAIQTLLTQIRELGDPAVVYDKECTIKPYFFDKDKDVELNPVSTLCENWDLWSECKNPLELGNASCYLIPKSVQGSDPFWVDSARTILTSMAWKMRDLEDKSAIKLLQLLLTTSLDDMASLLKGSEAENLVNREIAKTAISIKSVLATYTKALRFLEGLNNSDKPKFSIRQWVQDAVNPEKANGGWLFITSRSQYQKEIKPLISLWLGLALQAIQSLEQNSNRRIWIIMDELASLHRLEMLSDTMADIRKFGGCVAIGIQSVSQLRYLYGNDESEAINDLLNTKLYYRSPASKVAKWVSEELGEQVVEAVKESQSYGPNSIRDGNTVGSQREIRKTVDSGSVQTLEDLNCYIRLIGNHPVAKVQLNYIKREQLIEPLIERPINFDALEKINTEVLNIQSNPDINKEAKAIARFESEIDDKLRIIDVENKTKQQKIEESESSISDLDREEEIY